MASLEHIEDCERELRPCLPWDIELVLDDDLFGKAGQYGHLFGRQFKVFLFRIELIEDSDLSYLVREFRANFRWNTFWVRCCLLT